MTPLLSLADVELAQVIATAALPPFEQRAAFVMRAAHSVEAFAAQYLRDLQAAAAEIVSSLRSRPRR